MIENQQSKKHALLPATAGIPILSQSCSSWSSMVVRGDTMNTVEPIWEMGKLDWSAQIAPKFKAKTHSTLMCCFLGARSQTYLWAWGGPTRALASFSHIPSAMPPLCGWSWFHPGHYKVCPPVDFQMYSFLLHLLLPGSPWVGQGVLGGCASARNNHWGVWTFSPPHWP